MMIGKPGLRRLAASVVALAILTACGGDDHAGDGHGAPATATGGPAEVKVVARDLAFEAQNTYEINKPYRFAVQNSGVVDHEWVLTPVGAESGGHGHDDGHADALGEIKSEELKPGATATREVVFTEPGEYEMACHLPGHYEGGMKLVVKVQ